MINLFVACHPLEFFLAYISVIVKIKNPLNDFISLFKIIFITMPECEVRFFLPMYSTVRVNSLEMFQ